MQPTATGGFALDLKIARLTASIEDGGALAPIVAKLRERQTERNVLLGEIGTAESMRTLTLDRQVIERKVLAKVRAGVAAGRGIVERRQFLREVLDGPIYFKPEATRIGSGEPTDEAERFLTSWAVPPFVASPPGFGSA